MGNGRHLARLQTSRLLVREVEPADWPALNAILTDPEATRQMHFAAWDEGKRRSWFQWCLENATDPVSDTYNWGITLNDTRGLAGWLGIGGSSRSQVPSERGMGYILDRAYWSQGYMTEALIAILDYEFSVLGSTGVAANCETTNLASARVMEKAGMRYQRTATEPDFEGNVAERHYFAIDRADFVPAIT